MNTDPEDTNGRTQYIALYWQAVENVLRRVFEVSETDSMQQLMSDVATSELDEQLLFYHAEPLDVAADIAGISTEDLGAYVERYRVLFSTDHRSAER